MISGAPQDGATVSAALRDELRRLHEAVVYWSPSRWDRPAAGGTPDDRDGPRRNADVLHELVRTLAALGREAGSGAPPGVEPGQTGVHALADQFAVVAGELLAGLHLLDVVDRARAAVVDARTALFG